MKKTWFERLAPSALGAVFALGIGVMVLISLVQLLGRATKAMP